MIINKNQAQHCAITHSSGPMQVLAGPGSGKTTTIVKRVRYLVEVLKVPPETILVITFTKAAAQEMQSRFLTEIRRSYSAVNFGTFHSIYYQILIRSGYLKDFSLMTENEKTKMIKNILKQSSMEECGDVLSEISRIKNLEEPSSPQISEIFTEYCEMQKTVKKIDFDDMIRECHNMLIQNRHILEQWQQYFSYILVDEFQDINRLQYQILKLLAAPENNLFVVGDDDQSIYGFRGAKPAVISEFAEDYPTCKQVFLTVNYRSTNAIVEAAEKVIARNRQHIEKNCHALRAGSEVALIPFAEKEAENSFLMEQLKSLSPEISKSSAVILRTNHEAALLAVQCMEAGIPVWTAEKMPDIFTHFIGVDLMNYVQFAYQEKTRERFLNIINKPLRYISRKSVVTLEGVISEREILQYYEGNIDSQDEIRRFFKNCRQIAEMSPFLALHYIRKGIGYDRYLKERAKPGEYEEWMTIADKIQESAHGCTSFEEWFELVENVHQLCKQKPGVKNGIGLMTMHSSKGLEFHTVFLSHLNEGIVPNKKALTTEQIEEERRLFYVAMTRAKEKLWLLYTASSKSTPSRFLEPLLKQ